jgi:hypothetical protein
MRPRHVILARPLLPQNQTSRPRRKGLDLTARITEGIAAIGSIAVVLGGIVSLGSNVSTLQQTMAAMSAAEALRSDLISRIDLRVVGDKRL